MRRKLLDDLSISELKQMREDGMTNQEIADSLDVSYMTVLRVLGKQPDSMARKPRGGGSVVKAPPKKQEEECVPACLVTINRTIELQGATAKYVLNVEQKTINVKPENERRMFESLELNVDELDTFIEGLDTFIKELQAIQRKIGTVSTIEAW